MHEDVPVRPARRGNFARRWLFRLATLVALGALTEACSFLSWWAIDHRAFSYSRALRQERHLAPDGWGPKAVQEADGKTPTETFHIEPHPYLGFSYVPDWKGKIQASDPTSDWGFTDKANRSPVRPRGPGKVVVAILGGSVASQFSHNGVEALKRELKRSPQFANKEIDFVSLAIGAYKQPQQVMALNYALALGARYDVVVNLDGINEIAWYKQDHAEPRVCTLYPINWPLLVSEMPDAADRRLIGKIAYLTEERGRWASSFRKAPWCAFVTAHLVWKLRDQQMTAEITAAEHALHSRRGDQMPYRARGPRADFQNDQEMLEQLVGNWERCSLILERTCRAHGMRYIHFLQPNQYVIGSKPLSDTEKAKAIWAEFPARPMIEKGYPLLRAAGKRLSAKGVNFRDLSMAFAGNHDTLYYDNCCHINKTGNEVLAAAMAAAIVQTPEPPRAQQQPPGNARTAATGPRPPARRD